MVIADSRNKAGDNRMLLPINPKNALLLVCYYMISPVLKGITCEYGLQYIILLSMTNQRSMFSSGLRIFPIDFLLTWVYISVVLLL